MTTGLWSTEGTERRGSGRGAVNPCGGGAGIRNQYNQPQRSSQAPPLSQNSEEGARRDFRRVFKNEGGGSNRCIDADRDDEVLVQKRVMRST